MTRLPKVQRAYVSVTKRDNGSYELATIADGRRIWRTYYGYSKEECLRSFCRWANNVLLHSEDA